MRVALGLVTLAALTTVSAFAASYHGPLKVEKCFDNLNCGWNFNKGCAKIAPQDQDCASSFDNEETTKVYGCGYSNQATTLTEGTITGWTENAAASMTLQWSCLIIAGVADPTAPILEEDNGQVVKFVEGIIAACPPNIGCRDEADPVGYWEPYVRAS